jgi:hypothetical protein
MAALVAVYEAEFKDYTDLLAPGEVGGNFLTPSLHYANRDALLDTYYLLTGLYNLLDHVIPLPFRQDGGTYLNTLLCGAIDKLPFRFLQVPS